MYKIVNSFLSVALLTAVLTIGGASTTAFGSDERMFSVTITNLTKGPAAALGGQRFTPILVASHDSSVSLFTVGAPASLDLAFLAETGGPGMLAATLMATPGVLDVVTGAGLTPPGGSTTFTVEAGDDAEFLSVAAMLIPTNDGFMALNGVKAFTGKTETFIAVGYDAGSEVNNESCPDIPGPVCTGSGALGVPGGGEGFVHVHNGIHGIGTIPGGAAAHDWKNPVAKIVVTPLGDDDDDD